MISLALIGSFGTMEMLIILVVVLLIFGPKNLPKLGRMIGGGVRELRGSMSKAAGTDDDDDATQATHHAPPKVKVEKNDPADS